MAKTRFGIARVSMDGAHNRSCTGTDRWLLFETKLRAWGLLGPVEAVVLTLPIMCVLQYHCRRLCLQRICIVSRFHILLTKTSVMAGLLSPRFPHTSRSPILFLSSSPSKISRHEHLSLRYLRRKGKTRWDSQLVSRSVGSPWVCTHLQIVAVFNDCSPRADLECTPTYAPNTM